MEDDVCQEYSMKGKVYGKMINDITTRMYKDSSYIMTFQHLATSSLRLSASKQVYQGYMRNRKPRALMCYFAGHRPEAKNAWNAK
jgi:hypothetical protein